MFSGSIPALVKPFGLDGAAYEAAYGDLVDWQVAGAGSNDTRVATQNLRATKAPVALPGADNAPSKAESNT